MGDNDNKNYYMKTLKCHVNIAWLKNKKKLLPEHVGYSSLSL